jgi:uroporphyrinogen decarboxylase
MNSRERFLAAVEHKTPDRIPLDLGAGKACMFNEGFYKKLIKYLGIDEEIVLASKNNRTVVASDAVLERLECDIRSGYPFFKGSKTAAIVNKEWEDDEYYYFMNSFGTTLRMPKKDGHYYDMCKAPLEGSSEEEDAKYQWPEPPQIHPDGAARAIRYHEAGYPVTFIHHHGNGLLQNGPRIYGYADWLAMLAIEEERVHRHLDKFLELKIKFFDNVIDTYGDAVDVLVENDDLGTQAAPFISLEMFCKYMKPRWKILFDHIKKRSKAKIEFHSDGAMSDFIPDLIDVGVDILNPLQSNCAGMEADKIKKEFGKDIAFWGGGVDTQKVLPFGTPAEVREDVKRNIDILRKGGGFIFSTIHHIQEGVPIENFIAMWETFIENRDY